MNYSFFTCDVFTQKRFGGNPLAVLPSAEGLNSTQMQQIAREFNYSETAFVLPPEQNGTRKVRIFTPNAELPFAGHPNIGTAFVLAKTGILGEIKQIQHIVFEEVAGEVAIDIIPDNGEFYAQLRAPESFSLGQQFTPKHIAAVLGINAEHIDTAIHLPQFASVGLPFIITRVKNMDVLANIGINTTAISALELAGARAAFYVYAPSENTIDDEFDLRGRMFAPAFNIIEDPATGSANCALAALLSYHHPEPTTQLNWRIAQGVEMGRPSALMLQVEKQNNQVKDIYLGGHSVMVSQGEIEV